ncbi:MAG: hypothetical protein DRI57_21005 [Deltaproteobacteria bacterium]|nr:MAG: hypothetical protein DRI57_21005 [Deltaproteobacteria bacterium]
MPETVKTDLSLARKVCKELRDGNTDAILEIYHKYHSFFINFARSRLRDNPDRAEDVIQNFWKELLNGNAICEYDGRNNAGLRSFFTKILRWRVSDNERKHERTDDAEEYVNGTTSVHRTLSQEERILLTERKKFVHDALLILEKSSQKGDAELIRMRLFEKLDYQQIARRKLTSDPSDPKSIEKKAAALRKQFTRERTGSLAKFRIIAERLMEKYSWNMDDLTETGILPE